MGKRLEQEEMYTQTSNKKEGYCILPLDGSEQGEEEEKVVVEGEGVEEVEKKEEEEGESQVLTDLIYRAHFFSPSFFS